MARSDAHQSLLMSLTSQEPTSVLKCLHIYVSIPLEIGLASPDECFKNQLCPMYSRTSAAPHPGRASRARLLHKTGADPPQKRPEPQGKPGGSPAAEPPAAHACGAGSRASCDTGFLGDNLRQHRQVSPEAGRGPCGGPGSGPPAGRQRRRSHVARGLRRHAPR